MDGLRNFIGSRVRVLRKARGLTQADLGHLLGCDAALISRYERGQNAPGIDQLLLIAEAFEIFVGDLLPSPHDLLMEKVHDLKKELSEKAVQINSVQDLERLLVLADELLSKQKQPC
jgi:transcriptional regulator with XRE-family HTH domain